jgi:hypothetical protein
MFGYSIVGIVRFNGDTDVYQDMGIGKKQHGKQESV